MERRGSRQTRGKLSSPSSGGGAYTNYYKAEKDAKANPKAYAVASGAIKAAIADGGYDTSWQKDVEELVARESSFNPNAANPESSAKGLFQFLDATRKNYGGSKVNWSDPYQQAVAGLKYIKDRFGTPAEALAYWDKHGHY